MPRPTASWTYPTPICAMRLCKAVSAIQAKKVVRKAKRNYVIIRSVRARRRNEFIFIMRDRKTRDVAKIPPWCCDAHHSCVVRLVTSRDYIVRVAFGVRRVMGARWFVCVR